MSERNNKRERIRQAKRRFALPPGEFTPIDLSTLNHPEWMSRAYINNRYTVMIYDRCPTTKGPAIRAMVQRHDDKPIPNHWAEMQNIKNQLFGKETTAIEYYPSESELTNQHNIYWLWIFPSDIIPKAL